jgi:hypothetical protein
MIDGCIVVVTVVVVTSAGMAVGAMIGVAVLRFPEGAAWELLDLV